MGKTTTADLFREAGVPVFDADAAVHALYGPDGAMVPVLRAVFPDAVRDGAVDRARLSEHLRADPFHWEVLESFVHPLVGERRAEFLDAHADAPMVVLDVPLLLETGGEAHVDSVLVVTAPPEVQRARVLARPGMSAARFEALLARQMPDAAKRERADIVISTENGIADARAQVQSVLESLGVGSDD